MINDLTIKRGGSGSGPTTYQRKGPGRLKRGPGFECIVEGLKSSELTKNGHLRFSLGDVDPFGTGLWGPLSRPEKFQINKNKIYRIKDTTCD
jgi:hypothetical protein